MKIIEAFFSTPFGTVAFLWVFVLIGIYIAFRLRASHRKQKIAILTSTLFCLNFLVTFHLHYQYPSYQSKPQIGSHRPDTYPSDGSFGNIPPPASSTGNLPSLARQVTNQLELLRSNYAAAVGLWMNNDGTAESFGSRRTTPTERQLYDTLTFLLTSAKVLSATSSDGYTRQRAGQQMQADIQTAQQMWQRVKSTGVISTELDQQWRNSQRNIRAVINAASR